MTLAIGMICENGLMLATDTRLSYEGGAISHANKLTGFCTKMATYAIAHSSTDANAASSLMSEIQVKLEKADPKNNAVLEAAIKDVLQKWYVPVYDNRPTVGLLIGACIQGMPERDRFLLYACEPPITVTRIYMPYKAIGKGWEVSDPIYEWFKTESSPKPHACLCQISYMMYRAKKTFPGWIGGDTDVAFLTEPLTVPYWIDRFDMGKAEAYGAIFDATIADVATVITGNVPRGEADIRRVGSRVYSCGDLYRAVEFRCQFWDKTIRQ